jgi:iron complex transport system substrate-binding protein
MRIVSLLPAATEIVFALGLGRRLVGVDHTSDRPPEAAGRTVVTRPRKRRAARRSRTVHRTLAEARASGTSLVDLDVDRLVALRPDLILVGERGDPELAARSAVDVAVAELGGDVSVVTLAPSSFEGILHSITTVGAMTGAEAPAMRQVERMRGRLGRLERKVQRRREAGRPPTRVVALDWLDPPFAAGRWLPELVRRAGGWELLGREGEPSSETSWAAVREVDPEMLLLLPRGLDIHQAVAEWARTTRPRWWRTLGAVQRGQVFVLDGAGYFERPAPRIVDGVAMLAEILDPDAFVDVAPPASWTPVG